MIGRLRSQRGWSIATKWISSIVTSIPPQRALQSLCRASVSAGVLLCLATTTLYAQDGEAGVEQVSGRSFIVEGLIVGVLTIAAVFVICKTSRRT